MLLLNHIRYVQQVYLKFIITILKEKIKIFFY